MRSTLPAGLVLALLSLGLLPGAALAQAEPDPSPSPPAAATSGLEPTGTSSSTLEFSAPAWRRLAAEGGPAGREDHTWTVDEAGRFAYLFGGRDGGREFGDLWRYDLARDRWKRISAKGKRPAPRFGHSAVWVDGQGLAVFAGQRGDDFFADLWLFDPERARWSKLPSRGQVPKRRYGSCMVAGPDGRLWISHGFTDAGRFDDTRAYNLRTRRWAVITPDDHRPGQRCLHDCFTTATGELVLYGGQDDGHFALGDLWTMGRERVWQRRDDPRAQPRRLYGVTEAGAVAYVFGGAGDDDAKLADLWRVDRETLEFERLRVAGKNPSGRSAGALITDTLRGRLLLFGGQATNAARSDLWELVETAEPEEDTPEVEAATASPTAEISGSAQGE